MKLFLFSTFTPYILADTKTSINLVNNEVVIAFSVR